MITFKVTTSAHQEPEEPNTFSIGIIFRWRTGTLISYPIENLRIVFWYLWPNRYYQIPEEEKAHAPSRVSLATGVTVSRDTTPVYPPSSPEPLHEVELPVPLLEDLPPLPGIAEYNEPVAALQQRIEAYNILLRQLPVSEEQRVEQLLPRILSGVNPDEVAFTEGHITF